MDPRSLEVLNAIRERAVGIAKALLDMTGCTWHVIDPEPTKRNPDTMGHDFRFHLVSKDRVLRINRMVGSYERRIKVMGVVPRWHDDKQIGEWRSPDNARTFITVKWDCDYRKVASMIDRKILDSYNQLLAKRVVSNANRDKVNDEMLRDTKTLAKIMDAPVPPVKERDNRYNQDVTLMKCACHAESISIKAVLKRQIESISDAIYKPVECTVVVSNLTVEQAKDVLRFGLRLAQQRERNLLRRKVPPTPAKPKQSWET